MSEKLVVSAHQPNFIPYLGFFDKMKQSDVFVIRDEVLFVLKDYHRRNRLRVNGCDNLNDPQCSWLSVPVNDPKDYIKHVRIKNDAKVKNQSWNKHLLHQIKAAYSGAPYFNEYFPEVERIFSKTYEKLIDLNMEIIYFLKEKFEIKTPIVFASDLGLKPENYSPSDASKDLADICKKLEGKIYLSGSGGKNYLDGKPFEEEKIDLVYQDFKHPIYCQVFPGFLPNLGALDALFCVGGYPHE